MDGARTGRPDTGGVVMREGNDRSTDRDRDDLHCPVCGVGVLRDIAYDENPAVPGGIKQAPESREVVTFSCGHEVEAHRLEESARRDPNVEGRESDDTVDEIGLT